MFLIRTALYHCNVNNKLYIPIHFIKMAECWQYQLTAHKHFVELNDVFNKLAVYPCVASDGVAY